MTMRKKIKRVPQYDLVANVSLVPHGYEVDFFDGEGNCLGFVCRDFGSNYPVKKMRDVVQAGIIHIMEKVEDAYKKAYPQKGKKMAQKTAEQIRQELEVVVKSDKNATPEQKEAVLKALDKKANE